MYYFRPCLRAVAIAFVCLTLFVAGRALYAQGPSRGEGNPLQDHKCLQGNACPWVASVCENSFPACNQACDTECTPVMMLFCQYVQNEKCKTAGTYECPPAQKKTCQQDGMGACECDTPYLKGSYPCPSQTKCLQPS